MSDPAADTAEDTGMAATEIRDKFMWPAILIGVLLTAAGIVTPLLPDFGALEARLVLCSGLAILLAAFGSNATVKYKKSVTVVGAAAIAVVFWYLFTLERNSTSIPRGVMTGDVRGAVIEVSQGASYHGAFRGDNRRYEFIVIEPDSSQFFDVIIDFPASSDQPEQEFFFSDIPYNHISDYLTKQQIIEWRFDRATAQLLDKRSEQVIAAIDVPDIAAANFHPDSADQRSAYIEESKWFPIGLLPAAYAGENVSTLLNDLESGSISVRRGAREALAKQGLSAVSEMMQAFSQPSVSYRTRLGVLVALTQILRADKGQAEVLQSQLSEADLHNLIAAVEDKDRTLRVYAAEFLYALGDPRIVTQALDIAQKTSSDEGRYLSIFTLRNSYEKLPENERERIQIQLESIKDVSGVKTQQLIQSIQLK